MGIQGERPEGCLEGHLRGRNGNKNSNNGKDKPEKACNDREDSQYNMRV